jgi:hypothetical protein
VGGATASAGARRDTTARARSGVRPLDIGEIAWIALLPCALVTFAAVLLLGPPIGGAFPQAQPGALWPHAWAAPEPTEHGRYLAALLGPVLLSGLVVVAARRAPRLRPATAELLIRTSQGALAAFLVVCMAAQSNLVLRAYIVPEVPDRIFNPRTLAAAAAFALLLPFAARREPIAAAVRRAARETRRTQVVCVLLAVAATALWLLTAVNSDGTVGLAQGINLIPFQLDETFAVLDGRTPLVDFHALYGQLLPYVPAAVMALAGASITVWTLVMATLSCAALLGVYAIFRRILRSSPFALAVYLPFMATGFFLAWGSLENRFSPAGIFSLWPMRYGGAYLVAWLLARHADGAAPRRAWPLFLVAGLVALNNAELGLGAFAGALVAMAHLRPPASWRATARLLGTAAAGLLGAAALVSLATLARAHRLPRFSSLSDFPRLFGVDGWGLQPMPVFGLHLVLYVTFGGALAVATVRAVRRDDGNVLTSMLAWSGTFGLLAGAYYVGRSERLDLIALLSSWCFAVALLLIVVARSLAARGWRRPSLPELAVLFAFGLATCSLAQLPTPWSQVDRLGWRTPVAAFRRPDVAAFVARTLAPDERTVAILAPLGHRVAYDLHLTNVSPYSSVEAMPAVQQFRNTIAVLRQSHVHHVFMGIADTTSGNFLPDVLEAFRQEGFSIQAQGAGLLALTDATR